MEPTSNLRVRKTQSDLDPQLAWWVRKMTRHVQAKSPFAATPCQQRWVLPCLACYSCHSPLVQHLPFLPALSCCACMRCTLLQHACSTNAYVADGCMLSSFCVSQDLQEALDSCAWLPVAPGWTEHIAPGYHQPFYFHQATGRKQWQRPAVVEAQPASPFRVHPQSPITLAGVSSAAGLSRPPSYASELSDHSLENASVRTRQQPKTAATRSAVSCPCDASDACTAVFDIRCRKEVRSAKRTRDEDVTSKLADLDVNEGCMALFDSASELESARGGQGKRQQRKTSSAEHLQQGVQQVKAGLRRSNSCPWTPKQFEYCTQLAAIGY